MVCYAFVTRRGLDLVEEVGIPCTCSSDSSSVAPVPYGYRVVFGFFEGQFILEEIDNCMSCVAAAPGSAPVAKDHFKSFSPDSRVRTGGISFRKNVDVPARIQDIIDEFNEVKYIDSLNFECIQAEWSGSLSALQVVRLSEKVF